MKIVIPEHIKKMVERIEEEYKAQYTQTNGEINLYYAEAAKEFRKALDTQDTKIFEEDDEVSLRRQIVYYIDDLMEELSEDSYNRVTREVHCEEELEKVLTSKNLENSLKKEAKEIKKFIQKRQICSWGQNDSYVYNIYFKYLKSLSEFEELLSQEGYKELTPGDFNQFKEIRVIFTEKPKKKVCEEKGILDEFRKMLVSEDRSKEIGVFDVWNNIKEVGIYYIYIPN